MPDCALLFIVAQVSFAPDGFRQVLGFLFTYSFLLKFLRAGFATERG